MKVSNFTQIRKSSLTQSASLFSLFIVATSVVSEFLLDFDHLILVSTLILVFLFVIYFWGMTLRYHVSDWRIPASLAIVVFFAFGVTLLRYFDEPTRYYVLSSVINSNYPPAEPAFPEIPMLYYWRTDIIPSFFAHWFSLSALGANIVLNILIVQFSLQPIWSWANRENSNAMWLLAPLVFFTGSAITMFCALYWHTGSPEITHLEAYGEKFNVPLITYFGQPSFSHAFPAIVSIVIFCCGGIRSFDLSVPAVGLPALAIIHTTSYAALLPVVLLVTVLRGKLFAALILLVSSLALGYSLNPQLSNLLSGLFADNGHSSLHFRMGAIDGDVFRSVVFNIAQFGFLLFVPVWLLLTDLDRVSKIAALCIFFGCLVSFNFIKYENSWDMVKFLTLLTISCGIWALYIFEKGPSRLRKPIVFLIFIYGVFDSLWIYERANRIGLFKDGFEAGIATRLEQMKYSESDFSFLAAEFRRLDEERSIVISNVEDAEYRLLLNGQSIASLRDYEWERGLDRKLLKERKNLLGGWQHKDFSILFGSGIEILLTDCLPIRSIGASEFARVSDLKAYFIEDLSGNFDTSFLCR